jgi:hypothetical protein
MSEKQLQKGMKPGGRSRRRRDALTLETTLVRRSPNFQNRRFSSYIQSTKSKSRVSIAFKHKVGPGKTGILVVCVITTFSHSLKHWVVSFFHLHVTCERKQHKNDKPRHSTWVQVFKWERGPSGLKCYCAEKQIKLKHDREFADWQWSLRQE